MTKLRQRIHRQPELSFEEEQTASLVAQTLKDFGYEPQTGIAGTGVVAILDSGQPGKTVALRADMDALPIQEDSDLTYRSINQGKMHACGHDGHVATLLTAAYALQQCRNKLTKGHIKLIFQPAEEGHGGAQAMIDAGVLEAPKVDAIFGYHNMPQLPVGLVASRTGCIFAGVDFFSIHIQGKGGHGAMPEKTIDPLYNWHSGCTSFTRFDYKNDFGFRS